jgi:hypothetical protein
VSDGESELRRVLIWEFRIGGALGLPTWAASALVSTALYATYLIARWFITERPILELDPKLGLFLSDSARFTLALSLLLGYTLGVGRHLHVAGFRDLQQLGLEDPTTDIRSDPAQALGYEPDVVARSRLAGLAGMILGVVVIGLMILAEADRRSATFAEGLLFAISDFPSLWMILLGFLFFWMFGRSVFFTVQYVRSDTDRHLPVDLLNLKPLFVFGRAALRVSLAWIVGVSIATAMFALNPGPGGNLGARAFVLPVLCLGIGVSALLLPVRGLHRRIAQRKQEELEHLDAAIHGDLVALKRTQIADRAEELRLADLLAYKTHLEGLREWPFDASTLSRVGLYLLIPVGSWLGGACVERLLNLALD